MLNMKKHLAVALAVCGLAASGAVVAQAFPNKPLRIIPMGVGFPENTTRVVVAEMQTMINQSIIVEPKPGASGILASDYVAKQPADGYTVLVGTNSTHAANQSLFKKLPYDFIKDFVPISGISNNTLVLVVNPKNIQAKSVAELTAYARANPDKLTFGWGGSSPLASAELYNLLAGIKLRSVPYKTNPQVMIDLVGGRIDMMFSDMVVASPHIKSGSVRALAITNAQRLPFLPDVPTMQEGGVKDYEMSFWLAAYAPAGTPPDVVKRLNELFVAALARPKVVAYFQNSGGVPMPMSSDQLMKFQIAEHAKWKRIVEAAGIKPE